MFFVDFLGLKVFSLSSVHYPFSTFGGVLGGPRLLEMGMDLLLSYLAACKETFDARNIPTGTVCSG